MSRRGVRPQRGTHHTLVSDRSCCFYDPRPHHPPWPRLQRLFVRLARLGCARDAAAGRLGARAAGLVSRGAGVARRGAVRVAGSGTERLGGGRGLIARFEGIGGSDFLFWMSILRFRVACRREKWFSVYSGLLEEVNYRF
jgi:hypothetical protein